MADVLFGVSMQGDGVTKVISQKLDQALKHAGVGNMGWRTGAVGRLTAVLLQGVLGASVSSFAKARPARVPSSRRNLGRQGIHRACCAFPRSPGEQFRLAQKAQRHLVRRQ